MKEQRIILPQVSPEGRPLDLTRQCLERALLRNWGGFTLSTGCGGWEHNGRVYREPVWLFDVAAEDTADNRNRLRDVATWLARQADQQAVYVRHASGDVEFIVREQQLKEAA
jgi:hypothetical protein